MTILFLKIFSYPVLSKTSSLSLNDNTCRTSRNFTELTINYSSTPRFFSIYHCFKKALSDFFNLFDDFLLMISFPDIISSIICFFLSVSDNDWSNIDSLSGRKNSRSGWSITITFRAVGCFFWWWLGEEGGWVKMLATVVRRRQKILKKALKKSPKKWTLDQNLNDSKSHTWNSFFWNIILGMQFFYIRLHVPVDMIGMLVLISDVLVESLKTNKN